MKPRDEKIMIRQVSNGFTVFFYTWNYDHDRWDEFDSQVYSDPDCVVDVVRESIRNEKSLNSL